MYMLDLLVSFYIQFLSHSIALSVRVCLISLLFSQAQETIKKLTLADMV